MEMLERNFPFPFPFHYFSPILADSSRFRAVHVGCVRMQLAQLAKY